MVAYVTISYTATILRRLLLWANLIALAIQPVMALMPSVENGVSIYSWNSHITWPDGANMVTAMADVTYSAVLLF